MTYHVYSGALFLYKLIHTYHAGTMACRSANYIGDIDSKKLSGAHAAVSPDSIITPILTCMSCNLDMSIWRRL